MVIRGRTLASHCGEVDDGLVYLRQAVGGRGQHRLGHLVKHGAKVPDRLAGGGWRTHLRTPTTT
ncbi:hypothetical protein ACFQZB_02320 [Arthrobacter ulcerisalmonis]